MGERLAGMLVALGGRGPDSAGFAIYREDAPTRRAKLVVRERLPGIGWPEIEDRLLDRFGAAAAVAALADHRLFHVEGDPAEIAAYVHSHEPELQVVSTGFGIELYKAVGSPAHVVDLFELVRQSGTHAIGHTRMATESRVTTDGSHPFSTGPDLCLVHNGSLSNHNRLRLGLRRETLHFETENDSEVAAAYLTWRLREGATLDEALESCLDAFDGFYTFAVGTRNGFAVLRDPIACKPAVLAETDEWVAMASEFRAIATLPGAADAHVWEPAPGQVYHWERAAVA